MPSKIRCDLEIPLQLRISKPLFSIGKQIVFSSPAVYKPSIRNDARSINHWLVLCSTFPRLFFRSRRIRHLCPLPFVRFLAATLSVPAFRLEPEALPAKKAAGNRQCQGAYQHHKAFSPGRNIRYKRHRNAHHPVPAKKSAQNDHYPADHLFHIPSLLCRLPLYHRTLKKDRGKSAPVSKSFCRIQHIRHKIPQPCVVALGKAHAPRFPSWMMTTAGNPILAQKSCASFDAQLLQMSIYLYCSSSSCWISSARLICSFNFHFPMFTPSLRNIEPH